MSYESNERKEYAKWWVLVLGLVVVTGITFDKSTLVKVAKAKLESSYASEIKSVVKEVAGTCISLGIKIEGKTPKEFTAEINEGKWDSKLK